MEMIRERIVTGRLLIRAVVITVSRGIWKCCWLDLLVYLVPKRQQELSWSFVRISDACGVAAGCCF